MSWTGELLTAFAQLLDAAGAGTWRPPPAALGGDVPIVHGPLPSGFDSAIALQTYGAGADSDPVNTDGTLGLQVRMRAPGGIAAVDAIAERVFDALQGAELPAAGVLLCTRTVVAPLGQDGNGRFERADSYLLLTHHATTHRPG